MLVVSRPMMFIILLSTLGFICRSLMCTMNQRLWLIQFQSWRGKKINPKDDHIWFSPAKLLRFSGLPNYRPRESTLSWLIDPPPHSRPFLACRVQKAKNYTSQTFLQVELHKSSVVKWDFDSELKPHGERDKMSHGLVDVETVVGRGQCLQEQAAGLLPGASWPSQRQLLPGPRSTAVLGVILASSVQEAILCFPTAQ